MKTNIRSYAAKEQEKLRQNIKAMYRLRDMLLRKKEDDRTFTTKTKRLVIGELDEIIDLGLEEFYSFRAG